MQRSHFEIRKELRPTVGVAREIARDPEQVQWIDPCCEPHLQRPDIWSHVEADGIPIPAPEDREGYYGERHFAYRMSGYCDCRELLAAIPEAAQARCIFDFGGASGRITRHLIGGALRAPRVVLADLNINHVAFIAEHFPRNVVPIQLTDSPHVMLPDASVDVVCAYSVFTHIEVFEFSWLAELKRILRPGGHAYVTLQTEHTWEMLPEAHVYGAVASNKPFTGMFRRGEPMPSGRFVFRGTTDPNAPEYDCNVFHHTDYLERQWSRFFTIRKILPRNSVLYQTAVVLENA